ncbi:MAG TPA: hypothetical protein VJ792_10040 [Candidatus Nitrosotalea sp.]|nr:hypothetical protein [Candidatus Nitrosotalea sp.]
MLQVIKKLFKRLPCKAGTNPSQDGPALPQKISEFYYEIIIA